MLLVVALAASTARADSLALIDRPLTLPRGRVDLSLRGDLFNFTGAYHGFIAAGRYPDAPLVKVGYDGTGAVLAGGVDVGVVEGLQLGIEFGMPLAPEPAPCGTLLASGSLRLTDFLAARLDAGFVLAVTNYLDRVIPTVAVGAGLPLKVKLSSMFALVSGSSSALGFGRFYNRSATGRGIPLMPASGSINTFSLSLIGGSDLLNYSYAADGAFRQGTSYLVLNLPVGLLFQPHERVALTFRGSYTFEYRLEGGAERHYLPVGLEAVIAVTPQLDLGASFFLLGQVKGEPSLCSMGLDCAVGYAGTRLIAVFADARF